MSSKKGAFVYVNGLTMLAFGTGGMIYFFYTLRASPEILSFPVNLIIPLASLYAIARGIYLLRKKI